MKVGFIGVGKLGRDVTEVMAEYHEVTGYDIQDIEKPKGVNLVDAPELCVMGNDITFIAVQTPHDPKYVGEYPIAELEPKDFDYSYVIKVLDDIAPHTPKDHPVVIISTVLPGTTRREFAPRIPQANIIYNPYFIAMGTVKDDFRNPEFHTIGTSDGRGSKPLRDCYDAIYGWAGPKLCIGTWEESESTKVFYNTFISFKLAYVNMIQDVAQRTGHMNCDKVTDALKNATDRLISTKYMNSGMGDGGGCHPRDNIALRHLSQKLDLPYDIFSAVMLARDGQARAIAAYLWGLAQAINTPHVIIMGKSFKPNVTDSTGSASVLVGNIVADMGAEVDYDTVLEIPAVYLIAHPNKFNDLEFAEGSVVVDVNRQFPHQKGITVMHYGDTRPETH